MRLGRPTLPPPASTATPLSRRGRRAIVRMVPPPAAAAASAPNQNRGGIHLVSFDVDGTLIRSALPRKAGDRKSNALHKQAFSVAFAKCFGLDTHIDVCRHDGGTDPLILIKVLVDVHGLDAQEVKEKLPKMQQAMLDHYFGAVERSEEGQGEGGGEGGGEGEGGGGGAAHPGDGLELLPGAKETLEALAALGPSVAATCLVTGNLEPIGWAKMRALGLEALFTGPPRFGGFGSDFCSGDTVEMWRDRCEFVRVARRRAAELLPEGTFVRAHWHVGDTPADVRAALHAGAGAVAVATGAFSAEELRRAADEALAEVAALAAGGADGGADGARLPLPPVLVLEHGLRDVGAVLEAMGLPSPAAVVA